MNGKHIIHKLGLSGIIAASAALSLSLASPAQAADDHNSSRSNKSSSAADKELDKMAVGRYAELDETMTEIETLLSYIQENMARANELQAQLNEQNAQLSEARAASSGQAAELLSQIEEARRAFDTSVAPLLDPATVQQVSLHFDKIEAENKAIDDDDDGDGLDTEIEELAGAIGGALAALDACRESTDKIRASWNLKENVK